VNILVTGGCGFIGTRVCEKLLEQGHRVINVDKLTYAANEAKAVELSKDENYKLIVGDVCDWQLVYNVLKEYQVRIVMHLAAESHVDRSISGPQTFLEANVLGTYGVLEAVRAYLPTASRDFRMLHVSTDEVFGDMSLYSADKFTEESRYRPSSPYSASKAAADWLVRAWGRTFAVPWVMTHGANAYGPGQLPDKLVPMAIVNSLQGKPITLHGSGDNIRSWLHVDDHASGLIHVAMRGKLNNSYCLEAGTEMSNRAVVLLICDLLAQEGYKPEVIYTADRPGNDLRYSMSSDKVRSHTVWTSKINFLDGLKTTIQSYIKEAGNE